MKKTYSLTTLALILALLCFTACSSSGIESELPSKSPAPSALQTPAPKPTPKPTPTPEPTPDLTGLAIDPLTGLYIDEDAAAQRPVAVVINNIRQALPQSGLSQADIMYEVLAEGGITRLVGIFKDFDAEKIGPVRSARHYFLDFALDNYAFFAHHGGSPQGYDSIYSLGLDNLDGMADGQTFFRDKERSAIPGMYEHSSYTSAEGLKEALKVREFDLDLPEGYEPPFDFYSEDEKLTGDKVDSITVPFAPQSQTGLFEYNAKDKIYLRSQNGEEHIDEITGEQLSVSNVIVQYVSMYVISGDDAGRREVGLIGSGTGKLFTQGISEDIMWEKKSHDSPTVWSYPDGERIKLTPGKTWICVFGEGSEIITEPEPIEKTEQ